jgi:hypothetical protein
LIQQGKMGYFKLISYRAGELRTWDIRLKSQRMRRISQHRFRVGPALKKIMW